MNTHDAFMQAILANPDDDAPRLMYADWLTEHGDPRGEFIRLQCRLAQMSPDHEHFRLLKDMETALLEKHGNDWPPAPCVPDQFRAAQLPRRGFYESVYLTPEALLTPAPATIKVFKEHPIVAAQLVTDFSLIGTYPPIVWGEIQRPPLRRDRVVSHPVILWVMDNVEFLRGDLMRWLSLLISKNKKFKALVIHSVSILAETGGTPIHDLEDQHPIMSELLLCKELKQLRRIAITGCGGLQNRTDPDEDPLMDIHQLMKMGRFTLIIEKEYYSWADECNLISTWGARIKLI